MIRPLSIKNLLSESEYRIPIYQRNYAWGITEVTQLIQDIADYAKESGNDDYYVGSLVVFPHKSENYYETIDGQQRSTTLTIIACSIRHNCKEYDMAWYKSVNVSFDYRERSNETLRGIYQHSKPLLDSEKINTEIMSIYNKMWHIIEKECANRNLCVLKFAEYLFSKVVLLRVEVPTDTDLNHYFEIMNSRGEQLEQHEIVKALLMSALKNSSKDMQTFNHIWEACSNMGRYVQMNIGKDYRGLFFKKDKIENVETDFDILSEEMPKVTVLEGNDEKCLLDLFSDDLNNVPYDRPWDEQGKDKDQPESFGSIISFSNFLLHVLKVIYPQDEKIVLDDKRLIPIFKGCYESSSDKVNFVKDFIMRLLKLRYLFDKYVIKRKLEKWCLMRLKHKDSLYYGSTFSKQENEEDVYEKEIIMLQAMFHVSLPSQIYKHWLSAVLLYVDQYPETASRDFFKFLWSLAKSYMLDRYLAKGNLIHSFEDIIYKKSGVPQNRIDDIDWTNINVDGRRESNGHKQVGEQVENFVFNFYDYILWKEQRNADFEFSYRTSVEHFYPQHPINKNEMDPECLHGFGNLCFIS